MQHTIADFCKENRAALKMTNQQIADKSGIPLSTVTNFFSAASKSPSAETVGRICSVLGVSLDEHFGIDPLVDERVADKIEHQKEIIELLEEKANRYKRELYVSIAISCTLLVAFLISLFV